MSSGEGAPALPEQVLQSVVIVQRARAPEQRFDLPGQLILAPRTLPVLLSPRLTDSGDLEKLFPGRLDGAGLVDTLDLMIDQLDDGRCSVWGRLLTVIGRRHGSGIAHPRRVLLLEAKGTNGHRSGGPDIPKGLSSPAASAAWLRVRSSARRGVHGCDWAREYGLIRVFRTSASRRASR